MELPPRLFCFQTISAEHLFLNKQKCGILANIKKIYNIYFIMYIVKVEFVDPLKGFVIMVL